MWSVVAVLAVAAPVPLAPPAVTGVFGDCTGLWPPQGSYDDWCLEFVAVNGGRCCQRTLSLPVAASGCIPATEYYDEYCPVLVVAQDYTLCCYELGDQVNALFSTDYFGPDDYDDDMFIFDADGFELAIRVGAASSGSRARRSGSGV